MPDLNQNPHIKRGIIQYKISGELFNLIKRIQPDINKPDCPNIMDRVHPLTTIVLVNSGNINGRPNKYIITLKCWSGINATDITIDFYKNLKAISTVKTCE